MAAFDSSAESRAVSTQVVKAIISIHNPNLRKSLGSMCQYDGYINTHIIDCIIEETKVSLKFQRLS